MQLSPIIQSLRPKQWSKNLIIFASLIFSANFLDPVRVGRTLAAFVVFCLLSSAVYLLNDIFDVEQDRRHPLKRMRPIASGALPIRRAWALAAALLVLSLTAAFLLQPSLMAPVQYELDLAPARGHFLVRDVQPSFFVVALAYVVIASMYSLRLKHVVILDVIIIALGFVLRAVAGAVVIAVPLSSWLLICTVFLSLFLALCKRRHEVVLLDKDASSHRKTLSEYDAHLLDQLIAIVSSACIMAYALYTVSDDTVAKFHTQNLLLTIIFVVYGMFRYLYLVHRREVGGDPTVTLITDFPTIVNLGLWGLSCLFIVYHGVLSARGKL